MKRPPAKATQIIDGDRVRVTRFDFDPGAETGWHRHEFDYVIVTVTPCTMLLEEPGGETRTVSFEAGEAYQRPEGVEHNVINAGDQPMAFIETELKQAP